MKYWFKQIAKGCLFNGAILLCSCSVGPNYEIPSVSVPHHWSKPSSLTNERPLRGWWRDFHDPLLNDLIEQQALSNLDVQMAQARIKTARSEYSVAFAQLFPKIAAEAMPPDGTGFDLTQVLAFTTTIEPDFFGKHRETRHRAEANLAAEQALHDFVLLNLQAEIASTYLELREAQTRILILGRNIHGNKETLSLLNERLKAGFSNELSLAQQRALIEAQLADLQQNKAMVSMLLHKIEILTGKNPGVLSTQLLPYHPLPEMKRAISLGVPGKLLCRRPDIIAAERRVAAAHANIRVAIANLFPQITLGWLYAWQTQSIASSIFAMQDPESSFFGVFTAPLFNLTLYRAIDVRKRGAAAAVIQYRTTVLKALHEVETQYDYQKYYGLSARHLKRAVAEKRLVLNLAKDTYQKGAADFNTVLRSEEDLNHLELSHLHGVVIYQIAKINLYKALGGGINEVQHG